MKDERTYKIIGAALEVHKELGCGFLEAVYQEALGKEFTAQEIPFSSQPVLKIFYKGNPLVKTYQPDFVCYEEIIVEIKALSNLTFNGCRGGANYQLFESFRIQDRSLAQLWLQVAGTQKVCI
jgi:GxxExxY protein